MDIKGEGYEFDTIHYGGPFDGLDSSVISFTSTPPIISFYVIDKDKGYKGEESLGKKLLKKWGERHIPDSSRVAIYKLEGSPDEYSDEDIVPYHYRETLTFRDYKIKYNDKKIDFL